MRAINGGRALGTLQFEMHVIVIFNLSHSNYCPFLALVLYNIKLGAILACRFCKTETNFCFYRLNYKTTFFMELKS